MLRWTISTRTALPVCAAAGLLIALLVHGPAEATTARRLSLAEHVSKSDLVVLADVGEKRAFRGEDGLIYTDTTVHVAAVLHGTREASTLVVRQMGGVDGEELRYVPGDGRLASASRVVLFLADREPTSGVFFLTALGQSEYVVVGTKDDGDLLLTRDFHGLAFYDPASKTVAEPREGESLSLNSLQRAIAALARKEGK